jgi:hypothetical protein
LSDNLGFALAVIIAEIVPAAIALYAAYWAFAIRRALAGRIYRNHAFSLGVVCILFAVVSFAVPSTYSNNAIIKNAVGIFFLILNPVVFAFIDSTVRVARRSDPLLRSVFHWNKLRIVLWIDEIVLAIVLALSFVPSIVASVPQVGYLVPALLAIAYIAGAPALLIGASRSRDSTLRQSLRWAGWAFIMLFAYILYDVTIQLIIPGIGEFDRYYSYPAAFGGIIGILLSYALYRSVRSLAPINRLQTVESPTA